jgi:hypothetical protein
MCITTKRIVSRVGALFATCTIGVLAAVLIVVHFKSPRVAAFVLLGFVILALVLFLKLPSSAAEKRRMAEKHKIASRLRRCAYVFLFCYLTGWASYFSSKLQPIPVWKEFLISLIPAFCLILCPLWTAVQIDRTSEEEWRRTHL